MTHVELRPLALGHEILAPLLWGDRPLQSRREELHQSRFQVILLVIDLGDGCQRPDGFAMPSTGCTHPNPLKVRFTGMLFQHIPNETLNVFLCNFSDFSC